MRTPVIVNWVDIVSWSGWNDELIDSGEDKPAEYTTIGFLISHDEEKLTITDTYPDVGNVVTFPIGCVKSIIELGLSDLSGKSPKKGKK